MTAEIRPETTLVPLEDGDDVELTPGQPWPSAYRGSKYSLISSRRKNRGVVMEWQYHDLNVHLHPPSGLLDAMKEVGKSGGDGLGSFRITAAGEILTKVKADDYVNVEEAPVSDGWIPVYLGKLTGDLGFTNVDIDPEPLNGADLAVWEGLPFNHGERWSVSADNTLIWKWQDYRFESAFEHNDLVSTYTKYRDPAGRIHINEYGHVYVNIDPDNIPSGTEETVLTTFQEWQQAAEREGKKAAQRLVNRRLQATAPDNDPNEGLLPMYIGNLEEFDGGTIPRPVVDDKRYFIACGRNETSNGW